MNTWYEIGLLWEKGIDTLDGDTSEPTRDARTYAEQFTVAELAKLDQWRARVQAGRRVDARVSQAGRMLKKEKAPSATRS